MDRVDILIIEDNRHDAAMILDSFREQKIMDRVHVIRNGAEALDFFFGTGGCLENGDRRCPRFVLLDLKLPRVSGLEVLKRLRSDERTKTIPIVIFTSSNELKDRTESYRLGANSYIVKPLNADSFSRYAADIGMYWSHMNKTTDQDE
jgi:two-component system response regulator